MLSHDTGLGDGSVVAETPNPAVSHSLLHEIMQWRDEGATEQDIHCRLRCRTVPPQYTVSTWKPGMFYHHAVTEIHSICTINYQQYECNT